MLRHFLFTITIFCCTISIAQPYKNEWINYNKTYYKFAVKDQGLFRISKATLNNLGLGNVNA